MLESQRHAFKGDDSVRCEQCFQNKTHWIHAPAQAAPVPTLGRIVLFDDVDGSVSNEKGTTCAAVVTGVYKNTGVVDLAVFVAGVDGSRAVSNTAQWSWPSRST